MCNDKCNQISLSETLLAEVNVLQYANPVHVTLESSVIIDNFSKSMKVIGSYSEDSDRNFSLDNSSLLFLKSEYFPDEESREMTVCT